MGLLDRILGRSTPSLARSPHEPRKVRIDVTMSGLGDLGLVKLSGTTTFAKDAIKDLADRHGVADDGYLEVGGSLQREPENKADPSAVAVNAEGERIGYLPGFVAREVDLSDAGARLVPVQIFTELLPKGLRAEAWTWLGEGPPQWQWSRDNRPPMASRAKAQSHHQDVSDMVSAALAGGGDRAEQFKSGIVRGVHYLQLIEPIKQLKREERLEEALALCYAAIEGAESAAERDRMDPAPWYTEQAAIIHRKLKQHNEEIAVLERWLSACPPSRRDGSGIKARLDKLRP